MINFLTTLFFQSFHEIVQIVFILNNLGLELHKNEISDG